MVNTTRAIGFSDLNTLHHRVTCCHGFRSSSILTSYDIVGISISRHRRSFLTNPCLSLKVRPRTLRNRNSVVSFGSGGDLPGPTSGDSWKLWILGTVISLLIPLLKNKWGPLLALIQKADTVVDQLDDIVEVIDEVADKVEDIADDVGNKLPASGKLRHIADQIENVAKRISDDAHAADEILDRIDEIGEKVEKDVEALAGEVKNQANEEEKADILKT